MSEDTEFTEELSPEEREGYARLPREKEPGASLEERVVGELRSRGLLEPEGRGGRTDRRPVEVGGRDPTPGRGRHRRPAWIAGAAAAALALFLSGLVLGQGMGARSASSAFLAVRAQDAELAADRVQATGSAYVRALTTLAELSPEGEGSDREVRQGREAALGALLAAAEILTRLDPEDPAARDLLRTLRLTRGLEPGDTTGAQRFYWF